jgi:hypothetical protein
LFIVLAFVCSRIDAGGAAAAARRLHFFLPI